MHANLFPSSKERLQIVQRIKRSTFSQFYCWRGILSCFSQISWLWYIKKSTHFGRIIENKFSSHKKILPFFVEVPTLHMWDKQGIYWQNVNTKSMSRNNTHRQSWNLQAMLTGGTLKDWNKSRESEHAQE